jgi:hypothetical protein
MTSEVRWHNLPLHPELESKLEAQLTLENEKQPSPITMPMFLVSILCNYAFAKEADQRQNEFARTLQKELISKNVTFINAAQEALKK